jgi:hypothetical protein
MTEDSDAGYTQVLISFRHELLAGADATAGAADATAGSADAGHGTAALHFITLHGVHAPWALLVTVQPVAKRYIDTAAAGVSAGVLAAVGRLRVLIAELAPLHIRNHHHHGAAVDQKVLTASFKAAAETGTAWTAASQ